MRRKLLLAGLAAVVAGALALPPAASANTSAAPASLTFGNQTVGTTSAPQTVTVTATCTTSIVLCIIAGHFQPSPVFSGPAAGDFAQTNNCGSGFDAAVANVFCLFNVTFTPTATGMRTATLDVGDDTSLGGSQPANVSLTGSGIAPTSPPGTTSTAPTAPTAPTASATAPTGQRAAAIKKCKKKPKGPKRKKCIKKAKKLPV